MGWYSDYLRDKQAEGFAIFCEYTGLDCASKGCDAKRSTFMNSPYCYPHTVALIASRGIPQVEVEATLQALCDVVNGKP